MAVAILYLPDVGSAAVAVRPVAGRSLAFRVVVAAARAGVSVVGVPAGLRGEALERELQRSPEAARAVRWLDTAARPLGFDDRPCLLLPASMPPHAADLRALLGGAAGPAGAYLTSSAGGAPVLVAPGALVREAWPQLVAGQPLGAELIRHVHDARPPGVTAAHPVLAARSEADLVDVEVRLYAALGTEDDTGVDRHLHRRCSAWLTRRLVGTSVTPNQVSLASLAVGAAAVWCMWNASGASAALGVALYGGASVLDHVDGELARLTAQESTLGAQLDWTVDTLIHSGLALAMGITSATTPVGASLGMLGAAGVALSAALARHLPREIEVGSTMGGVLRHLGNRDLFYAVLLAFVALRELAPSLLPGLSALVAVGSQCYWAACWSRIRRSRIAALAMAGVTPR